MPRLTSLLFSLLLLITFALQAQTYTSWITGDTSDVNPTGIEGGVVLAGGGTDNDEAMTWMLNRAGGGDVLVIRASKSDGYNSYFFSELGVSVNSVETIRFDDDSAAYDPYVLRRLGEAELVFIAGGDQFDYYTYWKDSPVADSLNHLINVKGITIGGTSAGMAILGEAYYTPNAGSLTSAQALANPYHPNVDILGKGDFLSVPYLQDVVTDTHFAQRDRQGRLMTFLARLVTEHGTGAYAIACNEVTAVCVDAAGIARVFGEHPQYDDFAYFLKTNCQSEIGPETISANTPLNWNRQQSAVKVYKLPGTVNGSHTFDLKDWLTGSGGTWENWYVEQGTWQVVNDTDGDCASVILDLENDWQDLELALYPNPFHDTIQLQSVSPTAEPLSLAIHELNGRVVHHQTDLFVPQELNLDFLPAGTYLLSVERKGQTYTTTLVKQ
jgi:cyanophycinase-like exopeptidase